MKLDKKVHITQELLDDLEKTSGLKDLTTPQDLKNVFELDRVIIYLLVDWSGPERISRYYVYKSLTEIDIRETPAFKIDCSDQKKKYVEDWLVEQRENKGNFYTGGWGETVFVEKGKITDFITNPGQLGLDQTRKIIEKWKNTATNKRYITNGI